MPNNAPYARDAIHCYRPNEVIIREGEDSDRFFVILQGSVEIFQNTVSVRILTEGDVFGLENYYLKRNYTTSAKALTRSRISSYAASMVRNIIFERPQLTEKIMFSIVRQLEQTTENAALHPLLGTTIALDHTVYNDGDIIIREGDDGADMYRLVQSERGLRVTRSGLECALLCKPGAMFGVFSALMATPRSGTVTSCGVSLVEKIPAEDLNTIAAVHPLISLSIIKELTMRLRENTP